MTKPSAERWRVLSPLLDRALAVEGEEREAFLEELGSKDASLAAEVRDLLASEPALAERRFLETGAPLGEYLSAKAGSFAGTTLDAYTLDSPLGEGGMGTVWLARRSDGAYEGKVAVKLIRPTLDSGRVLLRFEAERRTLGRLDHPNIARVLDAGTADDGRPFFAMEYVEGKSLHEYCDGERLSLRARLAVFLDVCAGVQHAHRNGIIHRDLKPSNVLVAERDGRAVPKIIDFGIAKAVDPGIQDVTVTREGQWIGTPAYMSPEQFGDMGAVDTRSDVYSLGVILHELLVGVRPPPSRTPSGATTEASGLPTARFASLQGERESVAARRSTDPAGLARAVRGDLDRIVVKAIERDPERRYESVAALAEDIRAHLDDRPVRAGRESTAIRVRKFVRRHRAAVAAAAVALAALISGATIAAVGYRRAVVAERRAASERDRASREATTANRALGALTDVFEVSDPGESRGRTVTARELLDRGAARIQKEMKGEPAAEAKLLVTLGGVYRHLGVYDSAKSLLERAAALDGEVLGERDAETLGTRRLLALVLWEQGKLREAESLLRELHATCKSVLRDDDPETYRVESDLALVLQAEGKHAEAEPLARAALDGKRRVDPKNDTELLPTMSVLGVLLQQEGKYGEAERYLREVVDRARRAWGSDHQSTLLALNNLGLVLSAQGKLEEAEPYWRETLEARRRVLGKDHPQTLNSTYNLAMLLRSLGKLDAAEPLFDEAIAGYRKALGDDSQQTMKALAAIGGIRQAQRRWKEAETIHREVLSKRRRVLGDDHPDTIDSMTELGAVLTQLGRPTEAERLLRDASDRATRALGPESPSKLAASIALGDLLTTRRGPEAEGLLRDTLAIARAKLPPTHRIIGRALRSYGRCLTALGRYPEAEAALLEAHGQLAKSSPVNLREVEEHLAELYARWGEPEKAAEWRRKADAPPPRPS